MNEINTEDALCRCGHAWGAHRGDGLCLHCGCEAVLVDLRDVTALIADLLDPDPCRYDHHGFCQAHHLHERPCPHERGKMLGIEAGRMTSSEQDATREAALIHTTETEDR